MLRDTFPLLLDGQPAPACDTVWESSGFGSYQFADRCRSVRKKSTEFRQ
jgi:N-acyl-L-homoserine lactone synthetase